MIISVSAEDSFRHKDVFLSVRHINILAFTERNGHTRQDRKLKFNAKSSSVVIILLEMET